MQDLDALILDVEKLHKDLASVELCPFTEKVKEIIPALYAAAVNFASRADAPLASIVVNVLSGEPQLTTVSVAKELWVTEMFYYRVHHEENRWHAGYFKRQYQSPVGVKWKAASGESFVVFEDKPDLKYKPTPYYEFDPDVLARRNDGRHKKDWIYPWKVIVAQYKEGRVIIIDPWAPNKPWILVAQGNIRESQAISIIMGLVEEGCYARVVSNDERLQLLKTARDRIQTIMPKVKISQEADAAITRLNFIDRDPYGWKQR